MGQRRNTTALGLGALGVVFGDIGTSPLYALQAVFTADRHAVGTTPADVYGVVSLVFWAVTIIVSVKYVGVIMRADNDGEGGIMALTALVQGVRRAPRRAKHALVVLGILGAALFYGDAAVTPAISVVSATGGLEVALPGAAALVVPVSVAVLTALFAFQRSGTELIGRCFGPVMLVWFATIALAGLPEVLRHPAILEGLSPLYALDFLTGHGAVGILALASVVLAVTGAEALYADMGHFGRTPIRRAWFLVVFPALTINYLAQASLVLRSPEAIRNPFYLLVPGWGRLPMVVLATVATVIASQAVISGAFSVTRQAIQLGFLPQMTIRHTSDAHEGQVFAPAVNWLMFAVVVGLVLAFGSASALASAYGVAVSGTFVLNTVLFLAVARLRWHTRAPLLALAGGVFLTTELAFCLATLTKVVHGGWLPLLMGAAIFCVMMAWHRGQQLVSRRRTARVPALRDFVRDIHAARPPVRRVPGCAVYLTPDPRTTPLALRANVEHNHVLHERVLTVCMQVDHVPHVREEERLTATRLDDLTALVVRLGYQDRQDVPAALRLARRQGLLEGDLDPARTSYFVSQLTVVRSPRHRRPAPGRRLYLALSRIAASPVDHLRLPADRTVIVGADVEL